MKSTRKEEFTVSDGSLTLILEPAEEGGYLVRSPFDAELVTEAETLDEAFANAQDAADAMREARLKMQVAFETAFSAARSSSRTRLDLFPHLGDLAGHSATHGRVGDNRPGMGHDAVDG